LRTYSARTCPALPYLGAGEGGSYGDSINIPASLRRTTSPWMELRQSANTTHTDPFDTQAIEVVQGTSSVYSGVGALVGTITFVSKLPTATDFSNVSVGRRHGRLCARHPPTSTTRSAIRISAWAWRVNAMAHRKRSRRPRCNELHAVGHRNRHSRSASVLPTRLTVAYVHEHDRKPARIRDPFCAISHRWPASIATTTTASAMSTWRR